jgi:hypothetical protein
MKNSILAIVALPFILACSESEDTTVNKSTTQTRDDAVSGVVTEVIIVENYVYLEVNSEQGEIWIAANPVKVQEGNTVTASGVMLMENFRSSSLDRTFDRILFAETLEVGGQVIEQNNLPGAGPPSLPPGHPPPNAAGPKDSAPVSPAQRLEGATTIAAIFAAYPAIDGQVVRLRARVLKFSPAIMGANWITLEDGSGTEPNTVLVAKSQETVTIGETVSVTGTARVDVSLGYGYDYRILLEDATFSR